MLTTRTSTSALGSDRTPLRRPSAQTVVIVNGDSQSLQVLEPVLDAGNYHVVFVEASRHAYSQIRRTQPDLVILCLRLDEPEGFQVLSMLKLDEVTRDIPVVTCTGQSSAAEEEPEEEEEIAPPMFAAAPPSPLMN
ncbi:MAG: two-component system response regulator [Vicinamibacterales bacterium]